MVSDLMDDHSGDSDLVELAQRTLDATNKGDLDVLMSLYAPDAVWDSASSDLAGERFDGAAAIPDFFEEWLGALDDMYMEADEICHVGNGVVVCRLVQRGRPRWSSASLHFRFATVSIWVDGAIREVRVYTDIDAARAAAEQLAEERRWAVLQTQVDVMRPVAALGLEK
jgi:ketosteroid isomerase-like protein